jgi:hypothetical protein
VRQNRPEVEGEEEELEEVVQRDFSLLDSYDCVVNVKGKIRSQSFQLIERRLPSGVKDNIVME